MAISIGFSSLIGIIYSIVYSIVSFDFSFVAQFNTETMKFI